MTELSQQLGNYLLVEKIAQGGMAQVFKAKTVDPSGTERFVVIKRILPHISSDEEYIAMLIDEAKIAVHFNHGNIAQIYDLGRVGSDYFIAMEYVDGKTLGQVLRDFKEREKPIPLEIIVYCMAELCQALDYMHRRTDGNGKPLGVVHRDISPQNIIVSYAGTVKLIDFGVAKALDKVSHTQSGVLKGKFAYMSPEQAHGDRLDHRSDIFSTGILLWELLTLERLYKKETNKETLQAVRHANFIRPSKFRKEIPPALDAIVEKALKRKKEKRYQSAADMGQDLIRFLAKTYPDFRRTDVAQFLYRYFGPEADEEGLEPELPELLVQREPKRETSKVMPAPEDEEVTHRDKEITDKSLIRRKEPQSLVRRVALATFIGGLSLGLLMAGMIYYQNTLYGTLQIKTDPADAYIYLDDTLLDNEDAAKPMRLPSDQDMSLKVTRPEYESYESVFKLKRGEEKVAKIKLVKEVSPFSTLKVTSDPPGAVVYLNGELWNLKTPCEIPHLQSGRKYVLRFEMENYEPKEETVVPKRGEVVSISSVLSLQTSTVTIESVPPGALVIVDDQELGPTPYVDRALRPGDVIEYTVRMDGYPDQSQTVTLEAGENKKLIFDLKKSDNAPQGDF